VSLIDQESRGRIRTFLDEKDIEGGESIAEKIREGIRRCDELVVLLTPSSRHRQWVVVEMSVAWGLKKRIVAILHHVSPKEMPEISCPYKAIDLNDFDQYRTNYIRSKGQTDMNSAKRSKSQHPFRVFLSHDAADAGVARKIRNLLSHRLNVRVFMGEDLSAGGHWEAKLRREIEGADVVAALLTPHSVSSNWVLQEIGAAWGLEKPIISIVTQPDVRNRWPVQLNSEMALELKDLETPESANKFIDEFERTLAAAHGN
jgi:nucleoside 2-deoxyribosyltransferase